jgi:Flp pilus assembly protein TadG
MLRPLIERPRRSAIHRQRERGVTLALVALAIFSIVAMASLSIDVGTLYQASAEAQRAADAAALAAARMISVSGITGAAAPTTDTTAWQQICGGASGTATGTAVTVAQQNTVGGSTLPSASITVTYSVGNTAGTGASDCSTLGAGFGVNPVVTVQVTQSSLPTYFSRIWGRTGSSVSATASAEAFNPSGSGTYASGAEVIPVQPRCVKPWMVPNYEPWTPAGPCANNCSPFVDKLTGAIGSPGVLTDTPNSVIGQTFWLLADCVHDTATCNPLRDPSPRANINRSAFYPPLPNLEYLPAQTSFASTAIPSGTDACAAVTGNYAQAIAGCDQSTQYQCGKVLQNAVDLNENPGLGDTTNGAQCLTHQGAAASDTITALGQDALQPLATTPLTYPFQIQAGTSNPLTTVRGNLVTSSTSIVSLPIYDSTAVTTFGTGTTAVTVIGFLQVFINFVDQNGNLNVTVMNVAGCGNAATGTALTGTSPVPVRLITQP